MSKWKTALLVFLLALTMSTAVLAAGGIGVSQLAEPISQIPPAPHVSPFRVVAGVPVTEGPLDVPAPLVAPPEVRPGEDEAAPQRAAVAQPRGQVRPLAGVLPAPAVQRPVPRPSGGDAVVRPQPQPQPRPEPEPPRQDDEDTATPDEAPPPDDKVEDSDDDERRGRGNRARAASHQPESHNAATHAGDQGASGHEGDGPPHKNPGNGHDNEKSQGKGANGN